MSCSCSCNFECRVEKVALFECFPSASSRVDQINSDSLAAQNSTALVKRVKRHDCLPFDIGYFIHVHVGLMEGAGDVYIDVTFSHDIAPICSSIQLPFIYLNLSTILVPSSRFICRSQVSYHIFVYYFITRTRATRLAKRNISYLRVLDKS